MHAKNDDCVHCAVGVHIACQRGKVVANRCRWQAEKSTKWCLSICKNGQLLIALLPIKSVYRWTPVGKRSFFFKVSPERFKRNFDALVLTLGVLVFEKMYFSCYKISDLSVWSWP